MDVPLASAYSARWFAERYRIDAPAIEVRGLGGARGKAQLVLLGASSAQDAERLWQGLQRDLAPNQALGRRDDAIAWVIAPERAHVDAVLSLVKPQRRAPAANDADWLDRDVPPRLAGVRFAYELFDADLVARERKAGGVSLRFVFQRSFEVEQRSTPLPQRTTQATFWVPRDEADTAELARNLQKTKRPNETILSKRRAVVVLLSLNEPGADLLRAQLVSSGYRPLEP
jgi:hypothetical protein